MCLSVLFFLLFEYFEMAASPAVDGLALVAEDALVAAAARLVMEEVAEAVAVIKHSGRLYHAYVSRFMRDAVL